MRVLFVVVHRWAGLFIAAFLCVAGLTGAVISWDHELDEWLNPHLFETGSTGDTYPNFRSLGAAEDILRGCGGRSRPFFRGKRGHVLAAALRLVLRVPVVPTSCIAGVGA
jgi:hypothetical protein